MRETPLSEVLAEALDIVERLITAPRAGIFHPSISDQGPVLIGEPIGVLINSGEAAVLHSPFSGLLGGLLVLPGERVRRGQPVAWLTAEA